MSDEPPIPIRRNVFENADRNYENLTLVISFEQFHWDSQTYIEEEKTILQPQLEAMGYTEIIWLPGEFDSFGPLTRICRAFDIRGDLHWFVYG